MVVLKVTVTYYQLLICFRLVSIILYFVCSYDVNVQVQIQRRMMLLF